jgi:hypothetical protein
MVAHHINSQPAAPTPALRPDFTPGPPLFSGGLRKQTPEVQDLRFMPLVNSPHIGKISRFRLAFTLPPSPVPFCGQNLVGTGVRVGFGGTP